MSLEDVGVPLAVKGISGKLFRKGKVTRWYSDLAAVPGTIGYAYSYTPMVSVRVFGETEIWQVKHKFGATWELIPEWTVPLDFRNICYLLR